MKKHLSILIPAALGFCSVMANDGVYFTSGNQLVPIQETDISIRKEVLTIGLQDDNFASITVDYEFFNPGSTPKQLLMGFEADPSYNDDYQFHPDGKHPHIHDFTVEMNGERLQYKNAVCQQGTPDGILPLDMDKYQVSDMAVTVQPKDNDTLFIPFSYVYYFEATFRPGLNKIRHTYKYRQSTSIGCCFEIDYKLTPAIRWANGQIDDFTLVIRADHTAKHFIVEDDYFSSSPWMLTEGMGKQRTTTHYDTTYREFSLRNGAFVWHTNNFRPTFELEINSADLLYNFNDEASFGSSYDRTSIFALSYNQNENGRFTIPPYDEKLIKRIAHNLPFAHRGHVFQDPVLRAYFQKLWWYMPDKNYKDSQDDFTECDKEFLKF